jgi:hypothetical protein
MSRLLTALLVLALPRLLWAQGPLFQILDNPIPSAATPPDALGDLDGDGDADLLSANGAFLNDGHGRFTAVANSPLSFSRWGTTLADLNNDGMLDVVSIDSAHTVRIDLNFGGMSFGGPIGGLPAPPGYAVSLATGDVDLDGDVDILIGVQTPSISQGVLWLNNGGGVFTPGPFPGIALPVDRIFLRDLDADGDIDAVFSGYGTSIAVLTNVAGAFTPSASPAPPTNWVTVECGNFDGDSFPDLVVSIGAPTPPPGLLVFRGSPTGFLSPVTTATSVVAYALLAADLNGDGIDELVGQGPSWSSGGTWVRSVGPSGTLGPVTQSWPDLTLMQVARDLDGDGDLDLIASSPSGPVALMNAGNGNLVIVGGRTAGLKIATGQSWCDLDGDGDADLVGVQSLGLVTTGRNDGNGWFAGPAAPISVPTFLVTYSVEPFDGDGDGDSDLYLAAFSSANPSPFNDLVFANTGGVFTQVATVTGTGLTTRVKAADIDGDGDQDIVLGRWGAPMLMVPNLGGTGFGAPVPFGTASHVTYDFEVGDFDGNGLLDVFQLTSPTTVPPDWSIVWLNSASGFTQVVQTGISGSYVAAGDLNGDAIPDLVIDVQVSFSTGTGGLVPGPVLPSPLAGPVVLADVDHDGDLDLVETPATVFFNAGGGNFGPPVSYLPRPMFAATGLPIPRSIVVDVDHDGDLDIVAPGPVVLVNTTRQIAHGSVPRPGRPASIDLYGTPGAPWFLWASNGTTSFPFPPWGTVLIDPASAQLGALGQFPGSTSPLAGTATLSVLVPNNPALLGWTTYWQAIDAGQMRFTNRITVTVMSF